MPINDDYAQKLLLDLSNVSACQWCKHPRKPIYRVNLCRQCYDIRGKINRFRKKIEEYKRKRRGTPFGLKYLYLTALEMEKDAKIEGQAYGQAADGITGLRLEHEFSFVSRRWVHQDLFYGDANLFDWSFTPHQKRLLFHLLSLMSRAYLSRTRWNRALNSHILLKQSGVALKR
jgi:hypothetical protein